MDIMNHSRKRPRSFPADEEHVDIYGNHPPPKKRRVTQYSYIVQSKKVIKNSIAPQGSTARSRWDIINVASNVDQANQCVLRALLNVCNARSEREITTHCVRTIDSDQLIKYSIIPPNCENTAMIIWTEKHEVK